MKALGMGVMLVGGVLLPLGVGGEYNTSNSNA
jgi:hypothetical protein